MIQIKKKIQKYMKINNKQIKHIQYINNKNKSINYDLYKDNFNFLNI